MQNTDRSMLSGCRLGGTAGGARKFGGRGGRGAEGRIGGEEI